MKNENLSGNRIELKGIAFVLIALFCSAPLFAGIIDRQMLKDLATYNPYKYNRCFMYISNSIYTAVLAFTVSTIAIMAVKRKWRTEEYKAFFKREPWLIFWGCLLVWSIIPTVCSVNVVGAFWGATEMSSGYVSYLFSLSIMICAYWIGEEEREKLIDYYIIVSDLLAVVTLAYEYDIPFLKEFTPPMTGLAVFTNSNHYGYYLTVAIMCMTGKYFASLLKEKENVNRRKKTWGVIYLASVLLNMYTLVLNDTLGAYLAVLFATVFLMVIWRIRYGKMSIQNWIPFVALIILTVLSFFGIIMSKAGTTIGYSLVVFVADLLKLKHKSEGYELGGSRRIKIWKETIARIWEHPIIGYGPDMMFDEYGNILMESSPHNEFLECAFFLGVPGLIMYLGGLVKLCVDRCRGLKQLTSMQLISAGVVFGYLASSFFGVRKYHTSPYLYMFLGFLLLESKASQIRTSGEEKNGNKE